MNLRRRVAGRQLPVLCAALAAAASVQAQDTSVPPPAPAPAESPAPEPAPAPAPAPARPAPDAQTLDRVEVVGDRLSDTEERRQSTAAKIVVGRDEIERYGDSTVGELLKRLPGVTVQGAPGRGGAIRMRGLGSGYTQIVLDGDRVPPGFSLDSLTPEQIERIEILRAPTAETGVRAIAGTINIVTREGLRKSINDLKPGLALEAGQLSPNLAWTRNDTAGDLIYNLSLSVFQQRRERESDIETVNQTLADGRTTLAQNERITGQERGDGLHLSSRLQWRGEAGESLVLSPFVVWSHGHVDTESTLVQTVGVLPAPYAGAQASADNDFSMLRLNGQWNRRLGEGLRVEVRGGIGEARNSSQSLRTESGTPGGVPNVIDEDTDIRDRSLNLNGKLFALAGGGEHSIVSGFEVEGTRRAETQTTLQNGGNALPDYADTFDAATSRFALYAQDEWSPAPQWSAHAGLRWEAIATTGSEADGSPLRNVSSVWAPILHAVWKPEPKSRDQVRISVTRSYRTPALRELVARPTFSPRYPPPGPNQPTAPDRFGNPDLRPELATGIDLAFEHYPEGGGILSANLFRRNIDNLIRSVTTRQFVDYADVWRYVAQPQNIGDAVTQGIELEAKFRLSDVWPEAPRIDVRANLSFFHSSVASVPGPDNRLDQQPPATANLGADYRLRSLPLTLGASLNWNPDYTTRLSDAQTAIQGRKLVFDATALWVLTPAAQLRLTASNLTAADYLTGQSFDTDTERQTSRTTVRSYVNWLLRLELKL